MKEILPPVSPAEIIALVEESKKILKLMKCAFIYPQNERIVAHNHAWPYGIQRTLPFGCRVKSRFWVNAEYDASGMGIYWVLDINDCQLLS